ncbi:hypothetical protein K1W54_25455 [Micromonospora sp. CPCC 205371]|nr:hypothetical protein [Micromonospora sp. CPCC 205371]
MDLSVLESFSGAVDFEKDVRWLPLSATKSELAAAGVPAGWVELMSRSVSAVELIAQLWRPARAVLPRTADRFTRVHDVAVLSTRQRGASLVYLFRSADGTQTLWRGFAPATALPPIAARFPIELSALYSVHDGLVNFYSYDGGPLPCAEWRALTESDASDPSLVVIAQDGPRAFGFDVSQSPARAYDVDPEEDDVTLVVDPWAFLDDMTALEWLDE